jgi:hypothetical protein
MIPYLIIYKIVCRLSILPKYADVVSEISLLELKLPLSRQDSRPLPRDRENEKRSKRMPSPREVMVTCEHFHTHHFEARLRK